MIQRIQSVYLAVSSFLFAAMFFFPFITLTGVSAIYELKIMGINSITANDESLVLQGIPLFVLLMVLAILPIIILFLFKKRVLQMRLIVFSMLLAIGFIILIGFYAFVISDLDITGWTLNYPLIFPVVSIIFLFMAYKAIKRDEDLIKSIDRIR